MSDKKIKYPLSLYFRRSIRLKGYDYLQTGLYFVTVCVQNRQCLFGKIDDGKMIRKWHLELPNKFLDIELLTQPNGYRTNFTYYDTHH
jgi:hypothetical protein